MSVAILGTSFDRVAAMRAVVGIAIGAGAWIRQVYAEDFAVEYKGPNDPVTRADRGANEQIVRALTQRFPGIPVVAEESDPDSFAGFERAPAAWFVDPLDGTREFVAKNGEFCVMIGLAEAGRATGGVVHFPETGRTFLGVVGIAAEEHGGAAPRVSAITSPREARVVLSRSHHSKRTDEVLTRLAPARVTPTGSAGLKAVRVATGEADVFLSAGRAGKLWDACAPEAIVVAAGGRVTDARGRPFDYATPHLDNDHGLVATNGALHDAVLAAVAADLPR